MCVSKSSLNQSIRVNGIHRLPHIESISISPCASSIIADQARNEWCGSESTLLLLVRIAFEPYAGMTCSLITIKLWSCCAGENWVVNQAKFSLARLRDGCMPLHVLKGSLEKAIESQSHSWECGLIEYRTIHSKTRQQQHLLSFQVFGTAPEP